MEVDGVLFDVRFEGDEILVDERRDFVVAVRLGFQPSACSSGRSRAEVDQQRRLLLLCTRECFIGVCQPIYFHDISSVDINFS